MDRYTQVLSNCTKAYPEASAKKPADKMFDIKFMVDIKKRFEALGKADKEILISFIYQYGVAHGQAPGKSMPYGVKWEVDEHDRDRVYIELKNLPSQLVGMLDCYISSVSY